MRFKLVREVRTDQHTIANAAHVRRMPDIPTKTTRVHMATFIAVSAARAIIAIAVCSPLLIAPMVVSEHEESSLAENMGVTAERRMGGTPAHATIALLADMGEGCYVLSLYRSPSCMYVPASRMGVGSGRAACSSRG